MLMRIATILRPFSAPLVIIVGLAVSPLMGQPPAPNGDFAPSLDAARDLGISIEIELQKLPGATSAPVITALAGSRDGRFLVAAGDDHAIRIIDTSSAKTIQTVLGHEDWIQSLILVYPTKSEDQQDPAASVPELYSAGHDGRVLRWKSTFPIEAEEVAIVPYAVRSISVSAERQLLAIGGFSDEVLIYDLDAGEYVHRLKCSTKDQRTVRFCPDGSRVLSGSLDGEIRVWDSTSGELVADYHHHHRRVHTAVFSADGKYVTSAGADRRVVRFSLEEQRVVWDTEFALSKLMSLCLLNDDLVAVSGADNKIRLLDAQSESIVAELIGHSGTVAIMAPCGQSLASGSFDTTVRVWDLPKLEKFRSRAGLPTSLTPIKVDVKTQVR